MKTNKIHGTEIKDGYLLVVETSGETHNMTVGTNKEGHLGCVTPGNHWWCVHNFDEKGEYYDSQVVAIYGRTANRFLLDNSTEHRELLWEREPDHNFKAGDWVRIIGNGESRDKDVKHYFDFGDVVRVEGTCRHGKLHCVRESDELRQYVNPKHVEPAEAPTSKRMTVAEICEALGYDVEITKETN